MFAIFERLIAAGVPTTPSKAEALEAWSETYHDVDAPRAEASLTLCNLQNGRIVNVKDLNELIQKTDNGMVVNHIWLLCHVLQFPLKIFEKHHAVIGTDLLERMSKLHPHPMVLAYTLNGLTVPLLTWLSAHENRVSAILSEYLHCVWHSLPECTTWHWQLLPHDVNLHSDVASLEEKIGKFRPTSLHETSGKQRYYLVGHRSDGMYFQVTL